MSDEAIDTSEIPPLSKAFFEKATLRTPQHSVAVTVHVDPDVLAWFQAQGQDYEQRVNAALRIYAEAHQP
ncbi:MAG: BrnA antitoxin family protein [Pirellulales bacterium]|nr:BrnA antitoxin family protein [Pirellulales bacterium]